MTRDQRTQRFRGAGMTAVIEFPKHTSDPVGGLPNGVQKNKISGRVQSPGASAQETIQKIIRQVMSHGRAKDQSDCAFGERKRAGIRQKSRLLGIFSGHPPKLAEIGIQTNINPSVRQENTVQPRAPSDIQDHAWNKVQIRQLIPDPRSHFFCAGKALDLIINPGPGEDHWSSPAEQSVSS